MGEIMALERACFPDSPPGTLWTREQLLAHLRRFPEGQFGMAHDGRLVGTCTNMLTQRSEALAPHTWHQITGNGLLTTHRPDGDVLYGTEIMVDPGARRMGIGRALFNRRFRFVVEHGLRAFVTGGRIPGYRDHADELTPQEYVDLVARGDLTDPVLTPDLKWGCVSRGVLPRYIADPPSLGYATLLVWENPERAGREGGEGPEP